MDRKEFSPIRSRLGRTQNQLAELLSTLPFEKSKHLLIILISFWVMILPTNLAFSILDDSDIPVLGEADRDELILSLEKGEKALNFTFLIEYVLTARTFLARDSDLSDQPSASNSIALILRC